MREFDETDLEILSLLSADARRPFSEIGDRVGLSGPAVSARVTRLQEAGVIEGFTVDVDRAQLRAGVPVLVRAAVDADARETVRRRVADADAVEHVFLAADGEVWFQARAERGRVHAWLDGLLEGVDADREVTLLDEVAWTPAVEGAAFALTCAECGNTVDSEGESTRVDGELYHFCCPSCLSRFEERYRRIEEDA